MLEGRVHAVARGAGGLVNQHALGADHRVDERRLADVGTADHGQVHGAGRDRGRRRRRRPRTQHLQHLGHAAAVLGRDRHRLAEAQAIEVGQRALLPAGVDLVGGQHHRPLAAAQHAGDLGVERGHARPRVDDEEHQVGLVHRHQHLLAHALDERLLRRGIEAAGVDDGRLPALERHLAVQAIAGDAGHVAHEGAPLAHQPVEQRGLADVGTADDSDDGPGDRGGRPGLRVRLHALRCHHARCRSARRAGRAARARRQSPARRARARDRPA